MSYCAVSAAASVSGQRTKNILRDLLLERQSRPILLCRRPAGSPQRGFGSGLLDGRHGRRFVLCGGVRLLPQIRQSGAEQTQQRVTPFVFECASPSFAYIIQRGQGFAERHGVNVVILARQEFDGRRDA